MGNIEISCPIHLILYYLLVTSCSGGSLFPFGRLCVLVLTPTKIQQSGPQCSFKSFTSLWTITSLKSWREQTGSNEALLYVFIHGSHENTALLPLGANEIMSVTKDLYNAISCVLCLHWLIYLAERLLPEIHVSFN